MGEECSHAHILQLCIQITKAIETDVPVKLGESGLEVLVAFVVVAADVDAAACGGAYVNAAT